MKYCTKCGTPLDEMMVFCPKCGTNNTSESNQPIEEKLTISAANEQSNTVAKMRISMMIPMVISFVFAGIFLIGSLAEPSMLAGVFMFGIFGFMFLTLGKTKRATTRVFCELDCLKKTQGLSKGLFVGLCTFLGIFIFVAIINASTPTVSPENEGQTAVEKNHTSDEQKPAKESTPKVPDEFAGECPISVSASMYDNIINFPELSCHIKNNTDKEIAAVQIYFLPRDVYGDDADGIFAQNRLQSDTPINPNASKNFAWQLLDQTVKSGDVYIYSVYFTDGTEWGDRNASTSTIKKYALKVQANY